MTTTWSYRVLDDPDQGFRLIVAYSDAAGFVGGWHDAEPAGDTLDGLKGDLMHMLEATTKPVLTPADLSRP